MTLTCPHCGFSRELPPDQAPAVAVRVTCPRCREQFRFPAAEPVPPPLAEPVAATALPKAGFWIRLVAAVVDATLITALQLILGTVLIAAALMLTDEGGRGLGLFIAWSFGPALGVAYYVGFTGYCGQTPGKLALRVKVIGTDGGDIGYGRALLREVPGKFLSALLFGLGYLMIAFDGQKQGLHDKLVDTYVIKL